MGAPAMLTRLACFISPSTTASAASPHKIKYLITSVICYSFLTFGVVYTLPGPTLTDMALLTDSSFAQVSQGLIARSGAYCLGCLSAAVLLRRWTRYRHAAFLLCMWGSGLATLASPFARHPLFYHACLALTGLFVAGIDVAANAWLMAMWAERSAPFLQTMYTAYAVGATVAPVVVHRFLAREPLTADMDADARHAMLQSALLVPYGVAAAFAFIAAALLAALFLLSPLQQQQQESLDANRDASGLVVQTPEAEEERRREQRFQRRLLLLSHVLIFAYPAIEFNLMTFLPQFAVCSSWRASSSGSALILGILSASFAASRAACIAVAPRVSPATLLIASLASLACGCGIAFVADVAAAGQRPSHSLISMALVLMGAGCGPVTPAIYSFMRQRMQVRDHVCGLLMCAKSCAQVSVTLLMGALLTSHPDAFMHLNWGCLLVCSVNVAALLLNDRSHCVAGGYLKLPD